MLVFVGKFRRNGLLWILLLLNSSISCLYTLLLCFRDCAIALFQNKVALFSELSDSKHVDSCLWFSFTSNVDLSHYQYDKLLPSLRPSSAVPVRKIDISTPLILHPSSSANFPEHLRPHSATINLLWRKRVTYTCCRIDSGPLTLSLSLSPPPLEIHKKHIHKHQVEFTKTNIFLDSKEIKDFKHNGFL